MFFLTFFIIPFRSLCQFVMNKDFQYRVSHDIRVTMELLLYKGANVNFTLTRFVQF